MIKIGKKNFSLLRHDFNFISCWGALAPPPQPQLWACHRPIFTSSHVVCLNNPQLQVSAHAAAKNNPDKM